MNHTFILIFPPRQCCRAQKPGKRAFWAKGYEYKGRIAGDARNNRRGEKNAPRGAFHNTADPPIMTLINKGVAMRSMNARVTQPDEVLVRELDGESVLLNLATESYFGLDPVGTRMWFALTTSPSIEAAYVALAAEYEIEPEQLRADLAHFISSLAQAGLIDVSDL